MRITNIALNGSEVTAEVVDGLDFTPMRELAGQTVEGASASTLSFVPNVGARFVRIEAGGNIPLHAGPASGFVQVVRGRGKLVLPGGIRIPFVGPELFHFQAEALHGWDDIEEDTLIWRPV